MYSQNKFPVNSCGWRLLTAIFISVFIIKPVCLLAMELPPAIQQAFDKATLSEDDMLNGPGDTRKVLMTYMKENWGTVIDHFEEVAPTHLKKIVVIRAAESLEAQEYFVFLNRMKNLRESGRLSAEEFDFAVFPSRYKTDFLPYNYQNPEVRAFVESVRPLVTAGWQNGIDELLTGEMKKNKEQMRRGYHEGEFDGSLLLAPAVVPDPRKKPSRPLSDNNGRQNYSAMKNPLGNTDHVTSDNKLTEGHWFLWIVLFIAAVVFSGWLLRRSQQHK